MPEVYPYIIRAFGNHELPCKPTVITDLLRKHNIYPGNIEMKTDPHNGENGERNIYSFLAEEISYTAVQPLIEELKNLGNLYLARLMKEPFYPANGQNQRNV